jgi:hypothetical protein
MAAAAGLAVGFCEGQCGLVRADWFHAIGGFEPEFQLHWGIDIDLCVQAHRQGRGVWLHEGVYVRKQDSRGYSSGRYEMSAEERARRAGAAMDAVLMRKYGRPARALIAELEGTARPRDPLRRDRAARCTPCAGRPGAWARAWRRVSPATFGRGSRSLRRAATGSAHAWPDSASRSCSSSARTPLRTASSRGISSGSFARVGARS